MVKKTAFLVFSFIAAVALGLFIVELNNTVTGRYVTSGGGSWYYGTQQAHLQPDEACLFAGYTPVKPWRVITNEYGTLLSVCKDGNRIATAPIVQTIQVGDSSRSLKGIKRLV